MGDHSADSSEDVSRRIPMHISDELDENLQVCVSELELSSRAKELYESLARMMSDSSTSGDVKELAQALKDQWSEQNEDATDFEVEEFSYDLAKALDEYELRNFSAEERVLHENQIGLHSKALMEDFTREETSHTRRSVKKRKRNKTEDTMESSLINPENIGLGEENSSIPETQDLPLTEDMYPNFAPASACKIEELSGITLGARTLRHHLLRPTSWEHMKNMYVRVRHTHGYTLMLILDITELSQPYTYGATQQIVAINALSVKRVKHEIHLTVISNTPPKKEEYEEAKNAGLIPDFYTMKELYENWTNDALNRPMDREAVRLALLLQRRAEHSEQSLTPSKGNIVGEKVYLDRLLDITLPQEAKHSIENRLSQTVSSSQEFVAQRTSTVRMYIDKTNRNKKVNQRPPEVWEAVANTVHARGDGRSTTFWEDSNDATLETPRDTEEIPPEESVAAAHPLSAGRRNLTEDVLRGLPIPTLEQLEEWRAVLRQRNVGGIPAQTPAEA